MFEGTLPVALPFEIHPENARTAVLCLHGYTGCPGDLKYLAGRLSSAGVAVSVPRLPGAGTDLSDLSTTNRRDWKRRTYDAWLDLRSRYSRISVIGYSMGGLLALDLAGKVDMEKLVLLAPALQTTHRLMKLSPLIALFSGILPELKTGWKPEADDDEQTREYGRRYWMRRDLKSAAQLTRLSSEAKRKIKAIRIPVLCMVSTGDKSVPAEVAEILEQKLTNGLSRRVTLENCGHDLPQGADRNKVADIAIEWLKTPVLN